MHSRTTPRLSIIVATFNAARHIQHCLDSIDAQEFSARELIVVDGGSSDGTVDILRRRSARIHYWHSRPDMGIYDAWNQALQHARGEYVAFLGVDDALHAPDTLMRVFDAIGDREFDLVTGRGHLIGHNGTLLHEFGRPWDYRRVARKMTICHPGSLHRRELFTRFGLFDTSYRITADYDFLLRLPPDLRTLHIDAPLADIADGGISRDRRWQMLRERHRAQARCPRAGPVRATLNLADKLWRVPVGKVLGIPT